MSRPNFFAWVLWLVIGVGLGLYVGWVAAPVEYVDTAPDSLQQVYKDDYILMLATTYAGEGDLEAVYATLASLGISEPQAAVSATADRLTAAGYPAQDLERLTALAEALGNANAARPAPTP
jgi:hypothetical protein